MSKPVASELEYLSWFRVNADFGPAHSDVCARLDRRFTAETGKLPPEGWRDEEDREDEE